MAANSSLNVVIVNKLDENKEIKQVDDRRIYHLWEENQGSNTESNSSGEEDLEDLSEGVIPTENKEEKAPIHYFSEFVELLSDIISQQDDSQELLNKFSNEIFKYKELK